MYRPVWTLSSAFGVHEDTGASMDSGTTGRSPTGTPDGSCTTTAAVDEGVADAKALVALFAAAGAAAEDTAGACWALRVPHASADADADAADAAAVAVGHSH